MRTRAAWCVCVLGGRGSAGAAQLLFTCSAQRAGAHPSGSVSGRAWKPKGLSLRQFLRSSARRARATPAMVCCCSALARCSWLNEPAVPLDLRQDRYRWISRLLCFWDSGWGHLGALPCVPRLVKRDPQSNEVPTVQDYNDMILERYALGYVAFRAGFMTCCLLESCPPRSERSTGGLCMRA